MKKRRWPDAVFRSASVEQDRLGARRKTALAEEYRGSHGRTCVLSIHQRTRCRRFPDGINALDLLQNLRETGADDWSWRLKRERSRACGTYQTNPDSGPTGPWRSYAGLLRVERVGRVCHRGRRPDRGYFRLESCRRIRGQRLISRFWRMRSANRSSLSISTVPGRISTSAIVSLTSSPMINP